MTKNLRLSGVIDSVAEQKKIDGITQKGYQINIDNIAKLLRSYGVDVKKLDKKDLEYYETPSEIADRISF